MEFLKDYIEDMLSALAWKDLAPSKGFSALRRKHWAHPQLTFLSSRRFPEILP